MKSAEVSTQILVTALHGRPPTHADVRITDGGVVKETVRINLDPPGRDPEDITELRLLAKTLVEDALSVSPTGTVEDVNAKIRSMGR